MEDVKEKAPVEGRKELYVRIPLSRIRFSDIVDQMKLEDLLNTSKVNLAIEQIEDIFKNTTLTIQI